jgi:hypothetical protein
MGEALSTSCISIRVLLATSLACGLLGAPALAAKPAANPGATQTHVQTAQSGTLSASYSFTERSFRFASEQLTIRDAGQVVYQEPVRAPECDSGCSPEGIGGGSNPLKFVTLQPGGSPSLVLSLFSNGAHCCSVAQVFSPSPSGTWTVGSYDFGDPGFRLTDLAHVGVDDFLTADDRFAYAFTDFAASGLPVMVISYAGGQFQNVTRSYPALIRQDARDWLRAFKDQRRSGYGDTTGVIAAWAADEDELGRSATVDRYLATQARAGHLNSGLGNLVPQGFKFVRALRRFLAKRGYLSV